MKDQLTIHHCCNSDNHTKFMNTIPIINHSKLGKLKPSTVHKLLKAHTSCQMSQFSLCLHRLHVNNVDYVVYVVYLLFMRKYKQPESTCKSTSLVQVPFEVVFTAV